MEISRAQTPEQIKRGSLVEMRRTDTGLYMMVTEVRYICGVKYMTCQWGSSGMMAGIFREAELKIYKPKTRVRYSTGI